MLRSTSKFLLFCVAVTIVIAVVAGVAIYIVVFDKDETEFNLNLSPPSNSPLGSYNKAAVSCDAAYCSTIAADILKDGGSVADAAIGGLLCMGVIHSHSMGIGGGFFLVFYNATTRETKVLNAREPAPSAAYEEMFEEFPSNSTLGGLAVGIPSEMKGYWELHKAYGRLPWSRLLQPTISLCENGFNVTHSSARALQSSKRLILAEPSMAAIYMNPATGDVWKEGDIMVRPQLAETLKILAAHSQGGDALYDGPLAEKIVQDLENHGGIVTLEDMKNYRVTWSDPIELDIYGGYKMKTLPPPSSGILMGFMLRVLGDHLPKPKSIDEYVRIYQRILETFKYTYAKRSELGDPADDEVSDIVAEVVSLLKSEEFATTIRDSLMDARTNNTVEYYGAKFESLPEDHGTAHISIVGPNGDAIAATSTINLYFGAKIRSPSTGIIFNNEMDDFSSPNASNAFGLPPSVNNFIKPGKIPMSSMCPSIFVDAEGQVRLVVGAAGGSRITTATALVSIYNLWFNMDIKEAIDERRVHHQLFPMEVKHDEEFNQEILDSLSAYGHVVKMQALSSAVVGGVERIADGRLQANADFRKSGSIDGY